jgi:hypothetical protein
MSSGKCFRHGGATPKGKRWHRVKWPDGKAADYEAKLRRKLRKQEQAAEERAARIAVMSPEERAEHDAWQRAHKPGDPKKRAADREYRGQSRETAATLKRLAAAPRVLSPEMQAIEKELNALRAMRDGKPNPPEPDSQAAFPFPLTGVFA